MKDTQEVIQAVEAFRNLSPQDEATLLELNGKIQNHTGAWGVQRGGEKNEDGSIQMYWIQNNPLIYEFIGFMNDKNLLPFFEWMKWEDGSQLFASPDEYRYNNVDIESALMLIYAVTRKERFADGTLATAFDTGFPKLLQRLIWLRTHPDDK